MHKYTFLKMIPPWASAVVNAVALVTVQSIFAAYTVLLSTVFHGSTLNAWVFALFRDVLGGSILMSTAVLSVRQRRRVSAEPEKIVFWPMQSDLGSFIALGFLCVWGQGLYAMAVSLTTSDFATLMQPTQPVVAFAASVILGIEAFPVYRWHSWAKATAVLVAVGGAAFVVLQGLLSADSSLNSLSRNLPMGTVYLLLQVSLGGLYPVFMKPMLARYDPLVLVAWAYVFGAGFILISVLTCATSAADWHFTPVSGAAIAYSGVFSSAVAYFLMAW